MDINIFRSEKGGNPDLVRESQRRRGRPVETVDQIIALDILLRDAKTELNNLNREKKKFE